MTGKILRADGVTELANIKSVTFTECVNSDHNLKPGCVASARIDVVCYGSQSDAPSGGESLTYYQVNNGTEVLIGVFYAEPSIPSVGTFSFTAYDAISKLDADFSSRLQSIQSSFPMTVYSLVSEACTVAGVSLGSSSWPFSTYNVSAFYADNLTCRNIIQYAAEIACKFVRCDANGDLRFGWFTHSVKDVYGFGSFLNPSSTTYPSATTYPIAGFSVGSGADGNAMAYKEDGLNYENYDVTPISGVYIVPIETEGAAYVYGTQTNPLIISGNLLTNGWGAGTMTTIAKYIYDGVLSVGTWRPAKINLFTFENPFRAGQIVDVTDVQGVSFSFPVMQYTLNESAAELTATGDETMVNQTEFAKSALANLSASIVQLNKLKVNWAEIETAVINTLQANGINADWINAGALTVLDSSNRILLKADKDTSTAQVGGLTAGYGTTTMPDGWSQTGPTLEGNTVIKSPGQLCEDENLSMGYAVATVQEANGMRFYAGDDLGSMNCVGYIENRNILNLSGGVMGFTIGSNNELYIRVPTSNDFVVECDPVYAIYQERRPLAEIGNLSNLTTTATTSLVAAINELASRIGTLEAHTYPG